MTTITAEPASPRQARGNRPGSAFRNLTVTEAKLLAREVVPLLWGVGFPMLLLSVIGTFSSGPDKSLGGGTLVAAYVPILIAFSCATFALQGLPTVLTNYRERGILRRLNATPVAAPAEPPARHSATPKSHLSSPETTESLTRPWADTFSMERGAREPRCPFMAIVMGPRAKSIAKQQTAREGG